VETLSPDVAIIGAGPAGLFAAECLNAAGLTTHVYERMPSAGRKFLMAGRGGLNLTHSEPLGPFLQRYGEAEGWLAPAISGFSSADLRAWCEGLGQPTFIGSSGRVFPHAFKASPLLRAWLGRLKDQGVKLLTRTQWIGFHADGALVFDAAGQVLLVTPKAALLALGGASWPRLGADGSWVSLLAAEDVDVAPLVASNCGILINWSDHLKDRFAGQPLKRIALVHPERRVLGEAILSCTGLEGGAVYTIGNLIRRDLAKGTSPPVTVDLRPDLDIETLAHHLLTGRPKDSFSTHLRRAAKLDPAAISLFFENHRAPSRDPHTLAKAIKAVPLHIYGMSGIERAISSAGGVCAASFDDHFMLRKMPGVFVAGEMLDWDAPTGGYLLQASFATAARAAEGIIAWLSKPQS
jgi:uncharacterized flavoprotein (TIGR03862 family)